MGWKVKMSQGIGSEPGKRSALSLSGEGGLPCRLSHPKMKFVHVGCSGPGGHKQDEGHGQSTNGDDVHSPVQPDGPESLGHGPSASAAPTHHPKKITPH